HSASTDPAGPRFEADCAPRHPSRPHIPPPTAPRVHSSRRIVHPATRADCTFRLQLPRGSTVRGGLCTPPPEPTAHSASNCPTGPQFEADCTPGHPSRLYIPPPTPRGTRRALTR